jgi:hypothetical protein
MIRVDENVQKRLRGLADRAGTSIQQVVTDAVEVYERKLFWEQVNREYVALRKDPKAWKQELRERATWHSRISI